MKLVLLGPPGSGKGTQAKRLAKKYGIPHVSSGDILRAGFKEEGYLDGETREIVRSGKLVPDRIAVEIVRKRLGEEDCGKGFILDGFPRTLSQAESLNGFLQESDMPIDRVIYLELSQEEAVKRLSGRRTCHGCGATFHLVFNPPHTPGLCDRCGRQLSQREDDKEMTVRERMKTYERQTYPLIEYYKSRGLLAKINANKSIDEVFEDLCEVVDGRI